GGRSLEWWLGLDNDGPVIEDRTYIAATNKLSNGGFELFGPDGLALYWKTSEQSKWSIATSSAITTDNSVDGKDDVLASTETFEAPGGAVFRASVSHQRPGGATGRL